MRRRAQRGFTLLEVLAVVLLTSIVIGVALNHFVNLSRASRRATDTTRDLRRAVAVLDRVARDLEGAILISKDPEQDPLANPWLFYAESERSTIGADHLKFMTRGRRLRGATGPGSDLEVVVYALRTGPEAELELMRWSSPRLPEELDRELPDDEEDGALLLADGIADFGVTFIDELGQRSSRWDSSQLEESSELPLAADIEIAFADPDEDPDVEPRLYRRRVVFPVRPLDLQELLDPNSLVSGGTGSEEELAEEDEDRERQPGEKDECLASPCGRMTACQAIGCQAKLGRYGHSVDALLQNTIATNPTFCQWHRGNQKSVMWLVNNPACR